MNRSHSKTLLLALGAGVIVWLIDQASKALVVRELAPASADEVTIIPGVLRLIYVRNTGSAFGLFQGSSDILKVLALVAVLALALYYARTARHDPLVSLALGLQLGGALGNITDRFRRGHVVDWIDVSRWPTFNVADSAITVGAVLLIYALLVRDEIRRYRAFRAQRSVTDAPGEDA